MMIQQNYGFSGFNPFMAANPFIMYGYNSRLNFLFGMATATAAMQNSFPPRIPMNYCSVFNPCVAMNYSVPYTINGIGSLNYQPQVIPQGVTTPIFPSFHSPYIPTLSTSSLFSSSQNTGDVKEQSTLKYNNKSLYSIRNSNIMRNIPESRKNQILSAVDEACKKYDMDPKLVISMMYRESGFDPNATSRCGAAGLMQLMPATAKAYGANNVYDIRENIFAGVKYLSYLRQKYNGNRELMIAAYNAGPGRVHNSVPNITETKNYVARVNNTYSSLA